MRLPLLAQRIGTSASSHFSSMVLFGAGNDTSLFKDLATPRTGEPLFRNVDELRWRGPRADLATFAERFEAPQLLERALKVHASVTGTR